jgi:mono/diheme cytochrome c family protein
MRKRGVFGLLACAAALGLVFADSDDAAKRGEKLFGDRQEGLYPSCADCHSLLAEEQEAKAEHRGPGATLYGAAVREGWRNMNTFEDVGEASQKCAKSWQKREGGLDAAQRGDLVAFLKTHGPEGTLPKREVQRQPKLAKDFAGGDPAAGKRLAATWCFACHNEAEDSLSFAFEPGKRKRDQVARKVRGYDAKGAFKPEAEEASMSYFTNDRLSDDELKHILAYVAK